MAYPRRVKRALILFGSVWLVAGCGREASAPAAPARPVARVVLEPPRVTPSGCTATPATVYGDEPVVFDIQAPSRARSRVQLLDANGRSLVSESVSVPGRWQPAQVPSGDFALELGPDRVGCRVTVNRELARASQTPR